MKDKTGILKRHTSMRGPSIDCSQRLRGTQSIRNRHFGNNGPICQSRLKETKDQGEVATSVYCKNAIDCHRFARVTSPRSLTESYQY